MLESYFVDIETRGLTRVDDDVRHKRRDASCETLGSFCKSCLRRLFKEIVAVQQLCSMWQVFSIHVAS